MELLTSVQITAEAVYALMLWEYYESNKYASQLLRSMITLCSCYCINNTTSINCTGQWLLSDTVAV